MNRKTVFTTFALFMGVLLVAVLISLAQQTQPVQAISHHRTNTIEQGWQQVNVDGYGDENNKETMRLTIHNDYLFASTENQATGGEIWRSADGSAWNQVNLDGFGVISNTTAFVDGSFNNYLYAGTSNNSAGGEVWRCSVCDGTDWTQVVSNGFGDANNRTVQGVKVFSDTLYATVDNDSTGVEVWKSTTGNTGSWTQSNVDGFGNPQNTGAWAVAVFSDSLYIATAIADDWTPTGTFGVEVWRTDGGDNWDKVTSAGFGGTENVAWSLSVAGAKLYLTTGNFSGAQVWRCVTCDGSDWEHIVDGVFGPNAFAVSIFEFQNELFAVTTNNWTLGENGIEVWRSKDGVNWSQISNQGFGDVANGKSGTDAMGNYKGNLYLGTRNDATGTELWQLLHQVYLPMLSR